MPVLESDSVMRVIKKNLFFILVFSLLFNGCAWFHWGGSKSKISRRINPDDLVVKLDEKEAAVSGDLLKDGNLIDRRKLRLGGNVVVVPFSPGVNIEANDEFDKVTLRIIAGILDAFQDKSGVFTVLSSDEADQADFIIEGRVIEVQEHSMMKRVTLKNNRLRLSVQGKMIDRETGKPILIFSDSVEAKNKKETLGVLGTNIGQHIGQFIVTSASPNKN